MNKSLALKDVVLLPTLLAIKWTNNQESFIPFFLLRKRCPCAFCSGETDALGNQYRGPGFSVVKDILIINYSSVGHYGLRLYFSDGHKDGIYTFDFLKTCSEN